MEPLESITISQFFETMLPKLYDERKADLSDKLPDGLSIGFQVSGEETACWYLLFEGSELSVSSEPAGTVHLTVGFDKHDWDLMRPHISKWLEEDPDTSESHFLGKALRKEQLGLLTANSGVISLTVKNLHADGRPASVRFVIGHHDEHGLTRLEIETDQLALEKLRRGEVNLMQAMAMGLFQLRGDLGYGMRLGGLVMANR